MMIVVIIMPVCYDETDDNNAGDGCNVGGSDDDDVEYNYEDRDCDNEFMM